LNSSLEKFFGRNQEMVDSHEISISQYINGSLICTAMNMSDKPKNTEGNKQHRSHKKTGRNPGDRDGQAVPVSYKTTTMLLILMSGNRLVGHIHSGTYQRTIDILRN
jgi:hypothetical protein